MDTVITTKHFNGRQNTLLHRGGPPRNFKLFITTSHWFIQTTIVLSLDKALGGDKCTKLNNLYLWGDYLNLEGKTNTDIGTNDDTGCIQMF